MLNGAERYIIRLGIVTASLRLYRLLTWVSLQGLTGEIQVGR